MKNIWFKQKFVDPILNREKRDTVRKDSKRLPVEGEEFTMSVGPRKPFAIAVVDSRLPVSSLSADRKEQVIECLGELPENAVIITFTIQHTQKKQ